MTGWPTDELSPCSRTALQWNVQKGGHKSLQIAPLPLIVALIGLFFLPLRLLLLLSFLNLCYVFPVLVQSHNPDSPLEIFFFHYLSSLIDSAKDVDDVVSHNRVSFIFVFYKASHHIYYCPHGCSIVLNLLNHQRNLILYCCCIIGAISNFYLQLWQNL